MCENYCTCRACIMQRVAQVSLKSNAVWLRYEKKQIYQNKLNHKPQAHARVCEENAEENKK